MCACFRQLMERNHMLWKSFLSIYQGVGTIMSYNLSDIINHLITPEVFFPFFSKLQLEYTTQNNKLRNTYKRTFPFLRHDTVAHRLITASEWHKHINKSCWTAVIVATRPKVEHLSLLRILLVNISLFWACSGLITLGIFYLMIGTKALSFGYPANWLAFPNCFDLCCCCRLVATVHLHLCPHAKMHIASEISILLRNQSYLFQSLWQPI